MCQVPNLHESAMSWKSFYIQKRNFNSTGMKAPERKGKGRESQLCKRPLAFTQKTAAFCKNLSEYSVKIISTLGLSALSVQGMLLLLLLSRFSHVRLCMTPSSAAHQAPLSLGFSRQEHWSGLPFPSPMHESEKWKWNRSVVSDS